mgnify:CR=1 FL=1
MSKTDQKVIYPEGTPDYYREWGFSPAVECQGFIFISGCTGTSDDGTVPEDIEDQTRQAFKRINAVLEEAGIGYSNIVEMTTYHVGLSSHLEKFIAVKSEFISEPYPAWTAIGVTELASEGALVEIRVMAKT